MESPDPQEEIMALPKEIAEKLDELHYRIEDAASSIGEIERMIADTDSTMRVDVLELLLEKKRNHMLGISQQIDNLHAEFYPPSIRPKKLILSQEEEDIPE